MMPMSSTINGSSTIFTKAKSVVSTTFNSSGEKDSLVSQAECVENKKNPVVDRVSSMPQLHNVRKLDTTLLSTTTSEEENIHPAFSSVTRHSNAGLEMGLIPIAIEGCTGGAYYLRSPTHRIASVFKPMDEEPFGPNNPKSYEQSTTNTIGIKRGIPTGQAAIRECAAYWLDAHQPSVLNAGVPPTAMVMARHPKFAGESNEMKAGSLQEYQSHDCSADDVGSTKFKTSDVQRIAMLDIRLCNQDRHGGNILVKFPSQRIRSASCGDEAEISISVDDRVSLIPIDHGCCFPTYDAMDETSFVWLGWKQAKVPLSTEQLVAIASLDSQAEAAALQKSSEMDGHPLEDNALLSLHIGTAMLQIGASHGLSLFQIGSLMVRTTSEDEPSVCEVMVQETVESLQSSWNTSEFIDIFSSIFTRRIKKISAASATSYRRKSDCK